MRQLRAEDRQCADGNSSRHAAQPADSTRCRDYPFAALRTLLNPVTPRVNDPPILMSLGEPQHQPPALLAETLAAHAHEWNKYPPMAGTPELREAIAGWLTRRYRLAAGALDPERHVVEPRRHQGRPLPLVEHRRAAAKKAGQGRSCCAEPVLPRLQRRGDDGGRRGGVPRRDARQRFHARPRGDPAARHWNARAVLSVLAANPQGTIASLDYLKKAILLARQYDFVLAVDECYAEIYDFAAAARRARSLRRRWVTASPTSSSFIRCRSGRARRGCARALSPATRALIAPFKRICAITAAARCRCRSRRRRRRCGATRRMSSENRARYRRKFDIAEAALAGRYGFYRPGRRVFPVARCRRRRGGDAAAVARRGDPRPAGRLYRARRECWRQPGERVYSPGDRPRRGDARRRVRADSPACCSARA